MNESEPPPVISVAAAHPPVSDPAPESREPIATLAATFEAVLRAPRCVYYRLTQPDAPQLVAHLTVLAVMLALGYGLVVGSFSGGAQMWIAPLKVAGGLLGSALICLPSLYILACLGGSRATLREVGGLLAGLLALVTVLLIGFAPVAWVFSQSTESVVFMGSLHLLFALVAILFGLRLMRRGFVFLGGAGVGALLVWTTVFLLVIMQMTTALRPIVGTADTVLPTEKKFFLRYWNENLGLESKRDANPR